MAHADGDDHGPGAGVDAAQHPVRHLVDLRAQGFHVRQVPLLLVPLVLGLVAHETAHPSVLAGAVAGVSA